MTVPLAVAPSVKTPGLYLSLNMLAGVASTGADPLKICLIATKSAAGTLVENVDVRRLSGSDDASDGFGPGTIGHQAAKQIFDLYPLATVDACAPTAGATVSTIAATVSGAPTTATWLNIDIHGVTGRVEWAVGEAPNDIAIRVAAWINTRSDQLAASAVAAGAGVVNINGKVTGNCSKDIIIKITIGGPVTGVSAVTYAGSPAAVHLVGGTTDPDLTTILTKIAGTEYHFIVPCLSNTDCYAAASNLKKIRTHIELYNTGLNAKLQQIVYAMTGDGAGADGLAASKLVSVGAAGPHDAGGNVIYGELVLMINSRDLPGVIAAREAIGRVVAEGLDPAANRIGEQMSSLYGALDLNTDTPTAAEIEGSLNAGVAIMSYTAQGTPFIVRPITTHSVDTAGNPDVRCLDVQNVSGFYIPIRGIRDDLPLAFPNAKLVADTPEGDDPPPKGVTEERDIRAWIDERMRFWGREGVWLQANIEDAILTGKRVVQVNSTDPTQVDIVLPATVVPGLAKFGVYGQRVPA